MAKSDDYIEFGAGEFKEMKTLAAGGNDIDRMTIQVDVKTRPGRGTTYYLLRFNYVDHGYRSICHFDGDTLPFAKKTFVGILLFSDATFDSSDPFCYMSATIEVSLISGSIKRVYGNHVVAGENRVLGGWSEGIWTQDDEIEKLSLHSVGPNIPQLERFHVTKYPRQ